MDLTAIQLDGGENIAVRETGDEIGRALSDICRLNDGDVEATFGGSILKLTLEAGDPLHLPVRRIRWWVGISAERREEIRRANEEWAGLSDVKFAEPDWSTPELGDRVRAMFAGGEVVECEYVGIAPSDAPDDYVVLLDNGAHANAREIVEVIPCDEPEEWPGP